MSVLPPSPRRRNIHEQERRLAQVISTVGLGLMLAGFAGEWALHGNPTLPGPPAATWHTTNPQNISPFLICMSAGILLFALLPALRVLLALLDYVRRRNWRNALVALIVLLELFISTQTHRI
ncbi:MAG: DUF1634 domain-containing protein [Anaerolineae bacterium]